MTRVLVEDLPPLSGDLAALEHVAAAADQQIAGAAAVPLAPGQEPPAPRDRAGEFAGFLKVAVTMAAPALPFLPNCYSPEVCDQIGTAFAAVADKYGWEFAGLESPELALAIVTVPPTITAVLAGRQHFAALRAEQAKARAEVRPVSAIGTSHHTQEPGTPVYSPGHDGAR